MGVAAPVFAQNCNVQAEAIVKLRPPAFGSYNVWDTIFGEAEMDERFKDGLVLENNLILAVGERADPAQGDKKSILFAGVGRNGRVLWEKVHEAPNELDVVKLEPHDKGVVVLANITPVKGRPYIWMGFFDLQGEKLSEKTIKNSNENLVAYDIERSFSGKSYIIAAQAEKPKTGRPGWSVLYRVNSKGGVLSDKAFVIGTENAMRDLRVLDNGDVLAVGTINDADNRKTGWVMRLDEDLKMDWRKTYPRGAAAEFVRSHPLSKGYITVLGTALPAGSGNRAAWLMTIDEGNGDIAWQRYFSSENLHMDGRDLLVNKDRMISVLMDGQAPKDSDVDEHIRLLTLNPRGTLFVSNAFFNGQGVDAFNLVQSMERERVLFGETLLKHEVELEGPGQESGDETMVKTVLNSEGWVLTAPRVDSYEDPCIPVQREFP